MTAQSSMRCTFVAVTLLVLLPLTKTARARDAELSLPSDLQDGKDKAASVEPSTLPDTDEPSRQREPENVGRIEWFSELETALDRARVNNKPVLVFGTADWCPWCHHLKESLAHPKIISLLADWNCLEIDVDRFPRQARKLGIGSLPALRAVTAHGQVVARQDGALDVDALASWLQSQHERVEVRMSVVFLSKDKPDSQEIAELIDALGHRDAFVREAAMSRLIPWPETAHGVVSAFKQGGLMMQLSCLDVLEQWGAPCEGLDPWRPPTMTEDALERLHTWSQARTGQTNATQPAGGWQPDDQQAARRLLDQYLQVEELGKVRALRERLARFGEPLRDMVAEILASTDDAQARARLVALRYRLAMDPKLALRHPSLVEDLASVDADARQRAAKTLGRLTDWPSPALLAELLTSSDPHIRQVSVRLLSREGLQDDASRAITSLLNDPSADVQLAVLETLAQNPSTTASDAVLAYVDQQDDPDLIAQAMQVLVSMGSADALKGVLKLAAHQRWQIRAKAAQGLAAMWTDNKPYPLHLQQESVMQLLALASDEDAYVADRAGDALSEIAVGKELANTLVAALADQPERAAVLLTAVELPFQPGADVVAGLRSWSTHDHLSLRQAAILQSAACAPAQLHDVITDALQDTRLEVQQTAARAVVQACETWINHAGDNSPKSKPAVVEQSRTTPTDVAARRDAFQAGVLQPAWMQEWKLPLFYLMRDSEPMCQLQAAMALVPMGQEDEVRPVIEGLLPEFPEQISQVIDVVSWFSEQSLVQLGSMCVEFADGFELRDQLGDALAETCELAAVDVLLALVKQSERDGQPAERAKAVLTNLQQLHQCMSTRSEQDVMHTTAGFVQRLESEIIARTEMQKLVVMLSLAKISPAQARSIARSIAHNDDESERLRVDAFRIQLVLSEPANADQLALARLMEGASTEIMHVALTGLIHGQDVLDPLHRNDIAFHITNDAVDFPRAAERYAGQSSPIEVRLPTLLSSERAEKLLSSTDERIRTHAHYALTILGDEGHLGSVIDMWQAHPSELAWRWAAIRAIVSVGDDQYVPILERIYEQLRPDTNEMRLFYWTISQLEGTQALALRRRIRREVTMDQLRWQSH